MPDVLRRALRLLRALARTLHRDIFFDRDTSARADRHFADTVADDPRDARDKRADFATMS